MNRRWLLLRYDVESTESHTMDGFLAGLARAHRDHDLPVTLFCTGAALEAREDNFRAFSETVAGDARFDIGDHSYTHIGVGYERGSEVAVLRADYERSLNAHERILGKRPDSFSICGTGGKDGPRLSGFDATTKAREELVMLVALGFRRLNTFLTANDEGQDFTDYTSLGFPDVFGFPSAFSDTEWLWLVGKDTDFLAPIRAEIDRRSEANLPLPIICHDWVTWNHAPDRAFTHIARIAEYARQRGFVPMTHAQAVQEWRDAR